MLQDAPGNLTTVILSRLWEFSVIAVGLWSPGRLPLAPRGCLRKLRDQLSEPDTQAQSDRAEQRRPEGATHSHTQKVTTVCKFVISVF